LTSPRLATRVTCSSLHRADADSRLIRSGTRSAALTSSCAADDVRQPGHHGDNNALERGATLRPAEKECPVIAVWRRTAPLLFALAAACTGAPATTSGTSTQPITVDQPSVTPSPIGGSKTLPVLAGSAVPWIPTAGPPAATQAVPPGVGACNAANLSISIPGMEGATAGQMAGSILYRNTSHETCTLEGHPEVRLVGQNGATLPVSEGRFLPHSNPDRPFPPTWPFLVLHPGDEVTSFIESSNWCGPHVAAWRVSLPGGTGVTLKRGWTMGVCEFRADPSGLSLGGFEPPLQHEKWPFVPMILEAPRPSTTGSALDYVVTLMNVPKREFQFPATCPSYVERLKQHHRVIVSERLLLNCGGVGTIRVKRPCASRCR
jgi:hypothetical protein